MKKQKEGILLQTGTNELEIMEFTISGRHFGINVAKIDEISRAQPVTPMPNSNPFVEGVFKPRNIVLTLINLPAYLGLPESSDIDRDIYIMTNFNKNPSAFHVHSVEAIHRISWTNIEKPDPAIYGGEDGLATGIARVDDRLITIIDFEKILVDISPSAGIQVNQVNKFGDRPVCNRPILIADDSQILERMISESLERAGYKNLIHCTNGEEAWNLLRQYKQLGGDISNYVSCVVTDIEMPLMDGHRLTKLIREDRELAMLPVIVFSSLINDEMASKGKSVGVTAQISKPDIVTLINTIDHYVL